MQMSSDVMLRLPIVDMHDDLSPVSVVSVGKMQETLMLLWVISLFYMIYLCPHVAIFF